MALYVLGAAFFAFTNKKPQEGVLEKQHTVRAYPHNTDGFYCRFVSLQV